MKIALVALFGFLIFQGSHYKSLIGSVWAKKITKTASNTLTFKANGLVLEYDSELDCTFHSSYKLSGDTVTISGKDDSHSEDHGKINSYWVATYMIRGSGLYMIKNKVSFRGKWKAYTNKKDNIPDYKKIR